jgi:hypothetical protein
MSRQICLTRECLGLSMRIECRICPLGSGNGLWTLLCAAGLANAQPTEMKVQGPFHGPLEAGRVLDAIADNLLAQGYQEDSTQPIWRVHMQAELRRINGVSRRLAWQ